MNDVEPEVEVLAKGAGRDLRTQVAVGRRHHARVHACVRTVGADALNLAGLEKTQQRDLHARAHLADLVQEDGPIGRGFEKSLLVPVGARETAACMTEQLGLEQRVGQARAVQRHERAGGTAAALVDQPGDDLFPHARFAGEQDLGISARRLADLDLERSYHRALTDQPEAVIGGPDGTGMPRFFRCDTGT
jgi:hypothetical protein